MNDSLKIIFLDIDGILNRHIFNPIAQSASIDPACVEALNCIIHSTGAKVVLSSAWRYMVLNGACTLIGFQYLLRTHGVTNDCDLIAVTCSDEQVPGRGKQIEYWLKCNTHRTPSAFMVIDDEPVLCEEIRAMGYPLIQPVGTIGLTMQLAQNAIEILGEKQEEA